MMIRSVTDVGVATTIASRFAAFRSPATATSSATVSISAAARDAFAASNATPTSSTGGGVENSVEARLTEIRARGPVNRSQDDQEYLFTYDERLAEISAKSYGAQTADDIDYLQKATGLVNTFANLSPAEKALYDKAVASGNSAAAAGISQIALVRMMGHTAGGTNGTTYDPLNTEITAANIEKFFRHSIVDPTGEARSRFQALIHFLQEDPPT